MNDDDDDDKYGTLVRRIAQRMGLFLKTESAASTIANCYLISHDEAEIAFTLDNLRKTQPKLFWSPPKRTSPEERLDQANKRSPAPQRPRPPQKLPLTPQERAWVAKLSPVQRLTWHEERLAKLLAEKAREEK